MQQNPGTPARVLVIGTGLIGTSTCLALQRAGAMTFVEDTDDGHLRTAVALGAGLAWDSAAEVDPDLVVVGVPPAVLAEVVATSLERFPRAVVTDLGSVKQTVLHQLRTRSVDLSRYVGSHPMAGSEQSGPLAARADLFEGRAWALTPHADVAEQAAAAVEGLARACGAFTVRLEPERHDRAVALVSHLPQVAASVVAGLLTGADDEELSLAGQGLRDVTRIASSDTELWAQILAANAGPVSRLLYDASDRLRQVALALDKLPTEGAVDTDLREPLEHGVHGVQRLPGKHGAQVEAFAEVPVLLSDQPGELARLFADVGAAGVNIEDVRIDHSPGTSAGLVELAVHADTEEALLRALASRGWVVHG